LFSVDPSFRPEYAVFPVLKFKGWEGFHVLSLLAILLRSDSKGEGFLGGRFA
jgi:hypothetical protein